MELSKAAKQARLEYQREWRARNPGYDKKWREKNKESVLLSQREWRERNPEYYKRTQKERTEYLKDYLQRNPDKRKQYEATKWENKAKQIETDKLNSETDNIVETDKLTETVIETDNKIETDKCHYCNNSFKPKRSDAIYCSPRCRLKAYRQKK